jgi:hypothetical protein
VLVIEPAQHKREEPVGSVGVAPGMRMRKTHQP